MNRKLPQILATNYQRPLVLPIGLLNDSSKFPRGRSSLPPSSHASTTSTEEDEWTAIPSSLSNNLFLSVSVLIILSSLCFFPFRSLPWMKLWSPVVVMGVWFLSVRLMGVIVTSSIHMNSSSHSAATWNIIIQYTSFLSKFNKIHQSNTLSSLFFSLKLLFLWNFQLSF